MDRKSFGVRLLVSFLAAFATAEGGAILTAGLEDQRAFLFWTIPFCLIASATLVQLAYAAASTSTVRLILITIALGTCSGIGCTLAVATLLGPWFGAFGIPVLLCWSGAGLMAGLAGPIAVRTNPRVTSLGIAAGATVVVGAIVILPEAIPFLISDRQIAVIIFRHEAGTTPAKWDTGFSSSHWFDLAPNEMQTLEQLVGNGTLQPQGAGIYGRGRLARMIVVLREPVGTAVRFQLPADGTLFVVQQKDRWDEVFEGRKRLDRHFTLNDQHVRDQQGPIATDFMFENVDGSAQGGIAVTWH